MKKSNVMKPAKAMYKSALMRRWDGMVSRCASCNEWFRDGLAKSLHGLVVDERWGDGQL